MTSTELPQLSIQRYLELLKRRRWQVVPVSLLGLLIGGVVAFLIPRYYVASTLVTHQRIGDVSDPNDPFRQIVDSARETIPLAVSEALDQSGWPELVGLDRAQRNEFERAVEGRVRVDDRNKADKDRSYAKLQVQYRDVDGERSAAFLNLLVDTWIEKRIHELEVPTQARLVRARDRVDRANASLERLRRDRQDLMVSYQLDVRGDREGWERDRGERERERASLRAKLLGERQELAAEQLQLERRRLELADLPARVPPAPTYLIEAVAEVPAAKPILAVMLRAQAAMVNYQPGIPERQLAKLSYEQSLARLRAVVPGLALDPDGLIANLEYEELRQAVVELERECAARERKVAVLAGEVEGVASDLERRARGMRLLEEKQDQLEQAERERDNALEERRAAEAASNELDRDVPVEALDAQVPPAPTEPNILVVALVGCVLGLGAAVALILVFDFLQGTFKTIEDVERGLAAPVLGGISHLETEEERTTAVRGRRRASFAAASALMLLTIVVTIFYVDPTTLPEFVQELLVLLLGA